VEPVGEDGNSVVRQTVAPVEQSAIQADLSEIRDRLADISKMISAMKRSERLPVYSEEPAPTESESRAPTDEIAHSDRLRRIELELEAIRETIKEQVWIQSPPTIEQLRLAPQAPIWAELNSFCELYKADELAARESVLGRSYDEVLTRFGMPSTIEPTEWRYQHRGSSCWFQLDFVNGFVGGVLKF
jgi:hypothetical protein